MSKRKLYKYKILDVLKSSNLTIDDIEMHTGLDRLTIVPLIQRFLIWHDVIISSVEPNPNGRRDRKTYKITEKGDKKRKYFKNKFKSPKN